MLTDSRSIIAHEGDGEGLAEKVKEHNIWDLTLFATGHQDLRILTYVEL